MTESIYSTPKIKRYKLRRLNRNKDFWTAWKVGALPDKDRTRILYKLAGAMRWAEFTKAEILHMLRTWQLKHFAHYYTAELNHVVEAVEKWIRPRLQERWRNQKRTQRAKQSTSPERPKMTAEEKREKNRLRMRKYRAGKRAVQEVSNA